MISPEHVQQFGRFAAIAAPWIQLEANVLPILPGEKTPAVSGWGKRGPGPALHEVDSPKIPIERYAEWARQFPGHNVAVLPASMGATVVDVDNPALLDRVLEVCGLTDYRTLSPREGGGVHLWYAGATSTKNAITPGVDIKSSGGYVLAPGSIHRTGREYLASPALEGALRFGHILLPDPHPGWREALAALGSAMVEPGRLDLAALADRLQARNATRTWGRVLRAIANGQAFAKPGERDTALFRVLGLLAEEWPNASAESIVALFRPSIEVMLEADPDAPDLACVREKWERLTAERRDQDLSIEAEASERRRLAWRWVGIDSQATADPNTGPIVVHHGKSHFVRVGDTFAGPWSRDELSPDVLVTLGELYGLEEIENAGQLLACHGARAAEIHESLAVQRTYFDASTGTMHVACAPIRTDLKPERSPAVEHVIAELGGQYAAQLHHWLAGLLRTDVPCRALILSGERGCGKSMLLNGLGRLWPKGAAKMRDVLGKRFNSSMARSALALADDDTSPAESGEALATYLREAVSDRVQRLERKHLDVSSVHGCLRFAVGTNDPFDLVRGAVHYDLNTASLEAFGDRLLHVPVPPSARGCWERAGVTPGELVEGDLVARHVLWLAGQGYSAGDRFWVGEGDPDLARLAVVSCGLRGDVLVRLAGALDSLAPWGKESLTTRWCWALGDEVIVVNGPVMLKAWQLDSPPRGASSRTIGLALTALAGASRCEQVWARPRVHCVDRSLVEWYAEIVGV